jgi:hypothetical protein
LGALARASSSSNIPRAEKMIAAMSRAITIGMMMYYMVSSEIDAAIEFVSKGHRIAPAKRANDYLRWIPQTLALEPALAEAGENDEFPGRRLVLNAGVAMVGGWSPNRKLADYFSAARDSGAIARGVDDWLRITSLQRVVDSQGTSPVPYGDDLKPELGGLFPESY